MNAFDLDTPALYVDLDVLERNLARMQASCREWEVALRPHASTHKIAEIARMQLAAGAVGLAVAKLSEAEVLPGDDLLIAYPILPDQLPRLRALSRTRRVTVTVDSAEVARGLPGVTTLVEIDVGGGRCGVADSEYAVAVARACSDFRGIFYWSGGLDAGGLAAAGMKIAAVRAALQRAGFMTEVVSAGAPRPPLLPRPTAICPGAYVFNDATAIATGAATEADGALRVLVTVVSTAVAGQCVIDAGSKTFANDATPGCGTFGLFPGRSWAMRKMNEEHGFVAIAERARVGEKAWVIPSRAGSTVNMHDEIWFGRGGRVEGSWPVVARGKIR